MTAYVPDLHSKAFDLPGNAGSCTCLHSFHTKFLKCAGSSMAGACAILGSSDAYGAEKEQMRHAVQSVRSKLLSSLRAPERPLLDLGVGFSYELDTSDASLLARPHHVPV